MGKLYPFSCNGLTSVQQQYLTALLFRPLFHNSFQTVPKGAKYEYHTRKRRKNGREIDTKKLPLGAVDTALPLACPTIPHLAAYVQAAGRSGRVATGRGR